MHARDQAALAAFGLSFARWSYLLLWMLGHMGQCQEKPGTAGWEKGTHGNRKAQVWDGKELQSWFGDGEGVQLAGLKALCLSKHRQDRAFVF